MKNSIFTQKQSEQKLKVGDIFVSSWGYDETNYDFYQIVRRTQCFMTFRKISRSRDLQAEESKPYNKGIFEAFVPNKGDFIGEEFKSKISTTGIWCKMDESFKLGSKWDGKAVWENTFGY